MPESAFFKNTTFDTWHCKRGFPQYIWMHYQNAHRLRMIGITSSGFTSSAPFNFDVIGSMDCVHWTTMFNVRVSGFGCTGLNQRRSWVIPRRKRRSFTCIGLRINSIWNWRKPYCTLRHIDLWE